MARNVYEGMFILDSNRYARDPGGVAQQVPQLLERHGGEVLVSRLWNEQKLAYPIKGHKKGTYWLAYFRMDSSELANLRQDARLSEVILRSLVLKIDPRLVDTLVEHARTGTIVVRTDEVVSAAVDEEAAPDESDDESDDET